MLTKERKDKFFDDLNLVKNIQSINKLMNYGVSGYQDEEDKVLHYKCLSNKIQESQNNIENHLIIIESIADNRPPKRKPGSLFEIQEHKHINKSNRKKSKK